MEHTIIKNITVATSITLTELNKLITKFMNGATVKLFLNNKLPDYTNFLIDFPETYSYNFFKLKKAVEPNYRPLFVQTSDLHNIHNSPILDICAYEEFTRVTNDVKFKLISFSCKNIYCTEFDWEGTTTLSNYHVEQICANIRERLVKLNARFDMNTYA